jgi:hypothetical protein
MTPLFDWVIVWLLRSPHNGSKKMNINEKLHGDRFELLPIASIAMIFRIPLAHFFGGECDTLAFPPPA